MSELSQPKQTHLSIESAEAKLCESFRLDVGPELEATDSAVAVLATVLLSTAGERAGIVDIDEHGVPTGTGDVELLRLHALELMGARGFRVIRAARAVLERGYEAEARAHDRIIVELEEHRRAIVEDTSSAEAKAWIEGERGRGIGERVAKRAPAGLYFNLSMDSHGDPRPLRRLVDPETGALWLQPKRTEATRASLLAYASFARDQALAITVSAGATLTGLDKLDATIAAGQPVRG